MVSLVAGTALDVGHQEGPRLTDAIAPGGDIVSLQPAAGLVGRILGLLRQLALAAHTLAAVFPCVIKVGDVDGNADEAAKGEDGSGTDPPPNPSRQGGESFRLNVILFQGVSLSPP